MRLQEAAFECYLMRKSVTCEGSYSLDVKLKESVKHFLIRRNHEGEYEVAGAEKSFGSLPSLVDYYGSNVLSAEGEMLRKPLRRLNVNSSLLIDSEMLRKPLRQHDVNSSSLTDGEMLHTPLFEHRGSSRCIYILLSIL